MLKRRNTGKNAVTLDLRAIGRVGAREGGGVEMPVAEGGQSRDEQ